MTENKSTVCVVHCKDKECVLSLHTSFRKVSAVRAQLARFPADVKTIYGPFCACTSLRGELREPPPTLPVRKLRAFDV